MEQKFYVIVTLCICGLLISACGVKQPSETTFTPRVVASLTCSPTLQLSPTPSVTPTSTVSIFSQTPIPKLDDPIAVTNAKNIVEVARWGKGRPHQIAYSPDGALLGVATSVGLYVYDAKTFQQKLYIDTGEQNHDLNFSPDGKLLAGASVNNTVKIWDAGNGKEIQIFSGHSSPVLKVAFSPNGHMLASGAYDQVILWDISTGHEIHAFREVGYSMVNLTFSPDGKTIAMASEFQNVILWDVASGSEIMVLDVDIDRVYDIAFSPDGKTLASVSHEAGKLWDIVTGKQLTSFVDTHMYSITFSPDGKTLAYAASGNKIAIWDIASHTEQLVFWNTTDSKDTIFSPDGKTLAFLSWDGTITFLDVKWRLLIDHFVAGTDEVAKALVSTDGKLAVLALDGPRMDAVEAWDLASGKRIYRLVGSNTRLLTLSPDGRTLTFNEEANITSFFGVADRHRMGRLQTVDSPDSLAFSMDEQFFAMSGGYGARGEIRIMDISTDRQKIRTVLTGHKDVVSSLAFSPDGRLLASGSRDGTVKLWRIVGTLPPPILSGGWEMLEVRSVVFASDGQTLAAAADDGSVKVWKVSNGRLIYSLNKDILHSETGWLQARSVAFSPDGSILAGAFEDGFIRLWDMATGNELHRWKAHTLSVTSVVFTPDGTLLVSGSWDGTIRFWGVNLRMKSEG